MNLRNYYPKPKYLIIGAINPYSRLLDYPPMQDIQRGLAQRAGREEAWLPAEAGVGFP